MQLDDPELGPTWMAGLPVHLDRHARSAAAGRATCPTPTTTQIMAELDRSAQPAARMRAATSRTLAQPLEGLRVLDLCVALAGPTCGRLLGEFGADVIKINAPQSGGVSGYLNRGKRSLLLDLDIASKASRSSGSWSSRRDVVLENFSPGHGRSARHRLSSRCKARKPDIIYTSISCYGHGGPWTPGRGWERQGQAVTGIMERTGDDPGDSRPVQPRRHRHRRPGHVRDRSGRLPPAAHRPGPARPRLAGADRDVSPGALHARLRRARRDEPRGYEALGTGPLQRFYQARDGWFFLAAPDGGRGASEYGRGVADRQPRRRQRWSTTLEARFAELPAAVWVDRLRQAGVSAHAVVPVAELMADPWVRSQGLSVTQTVEDVGEVTMPGLSVRCRPRRCAWAARRTGRGPMPRPSCTRVGMADALPALARAWVLQTADLPSAW